MERGYGVQRWLPVLLVAAVITACASAGDTEAGAGAVAEPGDHIITVHNDHGSFTEVTVYIVPAAGIQQALGTVPANETRSFTFSGARGQYRLLARRPLGDGRTDTFNMPASGHAEWRTSQSRVLVRSR
jgi:hypothetical protein